MDVDSEQNQPSGRAHCHVSDASTEGTEDTVLGALNSESTPSTSPISRSTSAGPALVHPVETGVKEGDALPPLHPPPSASQREDPCMDDTHAEAAPAPVPAVATANEAQGNHEDEEAGGGGRGGEQAAEDEAAAPRKKTESSLSHRPNDPYCSVCLQLVPGPRAQAAGHALQAARAGRGEQGAIGPPPGWQLQEDDPTPEVTTLLQCDGGCMRSFHPLCLGWQPWEVPGWEAGQSAAQQGQGQSEGQGEGRSSDFYCKQCTEEKEGGVHSQGGSQWWCATGDVGQEVQGEGEGLGHPCGLCGQAGHVPYTPLWLYGRAGGQEGSTGAADVYALWLAHEGRSSAGRGVGSGVGRPGKKSEARAHAHAHAQAQAEGEGEGGAHGQAVQAGVGPTASQLAAHALAVAGIAPTASLAEICAPSSASSRPAPPPPPTMPALQAMLNALQEHAEATRTATLVQAVASRYAKTGENAPADPPPLPYTPPLLAGAPTCTVGTYWRGVHACAHPGCGRWYHYACLRRTSDIAVARYYHRQAVMHGQEPPVQVSCAAVAEDGVQGPHPPPPPAPAPAALMDEDSEGGGELGALPAGLSAEEAAAVRSAQRFSSTHAGLPPTPWPPTWLPPTVLPHVLRPIDYTTPDPALPWTTGLAGMEPVWLAPGMSPSFLCPRHTCAGCEGVGGGGVPGAALALGGAAEVVSHPGWAAWEAAEHARRAEMGGSGVPLPPAHAGTGTGTGVGGGKGGGTKGVSARKGNSGSSKEGRKQAVLAAEQAVLRSSTHSPIPQPPWVPAVNAILSALSSTTHPGPGPGGGPGPGEVDLRWVRALLTTAQTGGGGHGLPWPDLLPASDRAGEGGGSEYTRFEEQRWLAAKLGQGQGQGQGGEARGRSTRRGVTAKGREADAATAATYPLPTSYTWCPSLLALHLKANGVPCTGWDAPRLARGVQVHEGAHALPSHAWHCTLGSGFYSSAGRLPPTMILYQGIKASTSGRGGAGGRGATTCYSREDIGALGVAVGLGKGMSGSRTFVASFLRPDLQAHLTRQPVDPARVLHLVHTVLGGTGSGAGAVGSSSADALGTAASLPALPMLPALAHAATAMESPSPSSCPSFTLQPWQQAMLVCTDRVDLYTRLVTERKGREGGCLHCVRWYHPVPKGKGSRHGPVCLPEGHAANAFGLLCPLHALLPLPGETVDLVVSAMRTGEAGLGLMSDEELLHAVKAEQCTLLPPASRAALLLAGEEGEEGEEAEENEGDEEEAEGEEDEDGAVAVKGVSSALWCWPPAIRKLEAEAVVSLGKGAAGAILNLFAPMHRHPAAGETDHGKYWAALVTADPADGAATPFEHSYDAYALPPGLLAEVQGWEGRAAASGARKPPPYTRIEKNVYTIRVPPDPQQESEECSCWADAVAAASGAKARSSSSAGSGSGNGSGSGSGSGSGAAALLTSGAGGPVCGESCINRQLRVECVGPPGGVAGVSRAGASSGTHFPCTAPASAPASGEGTEQPGQGEGVGEEGEEGAGKKRKRPVAGAGQAASTMAPLKRINCCAGPVACGNRAMQLRQSPSLKLVETAGKGWGLVAQEHIQAGRFIIEYVGEIIDSAEQERRLAAAAARGETHAYMMAITEDILIDARFKANAARFINHSCDPNAELQRWDIAGYTRIGIFALRDIRAGEEVCYDYQFWSMEPLRCACGAASCRGWLGVDVAKKKQEEEEEEKAKAAAKKKKASAAAAAAKKRAQAQAGTAAGKGKGKVDGGAATVPPAALDEAMEGAQPEAGNDAVEGQMQVPPPSPASPVGQPPDPSLSLTALPATDTGIEGR